MDTWVLHGLHVYMHAGGLADLHTVNVLIFIFVIDGDDEGDDDRDLEVEEVLRNNYYL